MRSNHTSNPRSTGRSAAPALLLACVVLLVGSASRGAEPFRLRLVREAADVEAAAEGGGCVRGQLELVRAFGSGPTARGVWVADTLEASADPPSGTHAGVARDDGQTGWHIELPDSGAVLRAGRGAEAEATAGAILLGRRDASAEPAQACDPAAERLTDGAAIVRRLRDAYASPGNERAVQVSIEP